MICQNEAMYDITENIGHLLQAQFPQIKSFRRGWPNVKDFDVEGNLPAITFIDVGEKIVYANPQDTISHTTSSSIVYEKGRLYTLVQLSLFTNSRDIRDSLGFAIKQYLRVNYWIPILDYSQTTPNDTHEFMMIFLEGDHRSQKGIANFYQRDLTLRIRTKLLDAATAYPAKDIDISQTVNTSVDEYIKGDD